VPNDDGCGYRTGKEDDTMKILQIGKFMTPYHFGGIETVSLNLHNAIRERNIDIDFLGFLPKDNKHDIAINDNIYLCRIEADIFSTQFSFSFIKRWISIRNNYDIILINMPHPFVNTIINLFPVSNGKIVLYWHGDIIKYKIILWFYKPLLIRLIKKSIAVIAPTSIHLDRSDFSIYFSNKKYVIPYPLNIKCEKSDYKLYQNKRIIFSCGRLVYYKGFNNLIEAASYLLEDCVIMIAGDGPLRKVLQNKVEMLHLTEKVFLLGKINDSDLSRALKDCYLFCLPSNSTAEMFGVVQVEAFACGKPVVSTNIARSGVSEVNLDSRTGYTVEVNNPKALADAIKKLLEDKLLYESFSYNAIERARYFNSKEIIDIYISLFQKII
jgi:rhamnosyl/mannosyltransferase